MKMVISIPDFERVHIHYPRRGEVVIHGDRKMTVTNVDVHKYKVTLED